MDPALFLPLLTGIFLLARTAREATAASAQHLPEQHGPVRIRDLLRQAANGYRVQTVRVTLHQGRPAYWFTGGTRDEPRLPLVVFDAGQVLFLPPDQADAPGPLKNGLARLSPWTPGPHGPDWAREACALRVPARSSQRAVRGPRR